MNNLILGIVLFLVSTVGVGSEAAAKLYVKTYGDLSKPTFVFLHGGPGWNAFDFEFSTAEALAARGYGVVVYDQLGSGRSDSGKREDYTFERLTDDLRDVIVDLRLGRPVLIGHSFGGTFGLHFLDRYPELVAGMVLVGSPVSYPETLRGIVAQCSHLSEAANADPEDHGAESVSRIFELAGACGLYVPKNLTPEALALYQRLGALDATGLMGANAADSTEEGSPFNGLILNEGYADLDLGALIERHQDRLSGIYGEEDGLLDAAHLARIRKLLAPGKLTVVENASHAVFIHQQEAFLDALEAQVPPSALPPQPM